jgi:hypothetical protein
MSQAQRGADGEDAGPGERDAGSAAKRVRGDVAVIESEVGCWAAANDVGAIDRTVATDAVVDPISNLLEPDFVSRRVGNFEYNPQWGMLVDQLWVR